MEIERVLALVIEALEKSGIDYMITGSFASSLHGMPRTTFDADIVIAADVKRIELFVGHIEKDFYVDIDTAREAVKERRMFNVIHFETGFKVDLIVKKTGEYFETEFARRKTYKFGKNLYFFASPEDTILSKLRWAKIANSERQFQDAVGVAKAQKKLDYQYLGKSAKLLGVSDLLEKLLKDIEGK